jgi:hypothetical protein
MVYESVAGGWVESDGAESTPVVPHADGARMR